MQGVIAWLIVHQCLYTNRRFFSCGPQAFMHAQIFHSSCEILDSDKNIGEPISPLYFVMCLKRIEKSMNNLSQSVPSLITDANAKLFRTSSVYNVGLK